MCLRDVELGESGLTTVSLAVQDQYSAFFERVLLGQFVCGECMLCLKDGSPKLVNHGYISKEGYDAWMKTRPASMPVRPKSHRQTAKTETKAKTLLRWPNLDRFGEAHGYDSSIPPLR